MRLNIWQSGRKLRQTSYWTSKVCQRTKTLGIKPCCIVICSTFEAEEEDVQGYSGEEGGVVGVQSSQNQKMGI